MFFHKSDLAVILHSLELLSPSRARRHRGHGLHGGHGSSRLDGGLHEGALLVPGVAVRMLGAAGVGGAAGLP